MGKIRDFFFGNPIGPKSSALVYAVALEFVLIGIIPFHFLFLKNYHELRMSYIPESWYNYHEGGPKVITKKGIRYTSYHNNTTKEDSDGTVLRVPPGSELEVAIVCMKDYPDKPPYFDTAFYECEIGVYTLWGGIPLDWVEGSEQIIMDLDELRPKEAKEKTENTVKAVLGIILSVVLTCGAVFLLCKVFKNREELHYLFIAVWILAGVILWVF